MRAIVLSVLLSVGMAWDAWALPIVWDIVDGGNGHYYELIEDSLSWSDAYRVAGSRGFLGSAGHLVTITSVQETAFLNLHFELNHQWIGLCQATIGSEPDGGWVWITGEPLLYTNWGMFEPNESGVEDWGAFGTDDTGTWQDWKHFGDPPPHRLRGYFVEYEPPFIPEPSSLLLLGSGLLGLAGFRRRRAQ